MPAPFIHKTLTRTLLCAWLALSLGLAPMPAMRAAAQASSAAEKIRPDLAAVLQAATPDDRVAVIVTLADQPDPAVLAVQGTGGSRLERLIIGLQEHAEISQHHLHTIIDSRLLTGEASDVTYFWIFNGMALHATPALIRELATLSEVAEIRPEVVIAAPLVIPADAPPADVLTQIGAPELWALGIRGQGVVVANLDTGVDVNHPDLKANWRGGTNSWFDPTTSNPTSYPVDTSGHGTATMGIMVGGSASGKAIGVAPDAKWIAARIFNGGSSSADTESYIHLAFEWILDPDHNTATDDAPQVVNNSWADSVATCDGLNAFQKDFQDLVNAGILPVFSAGNYGPGLSTQRSPASRPEAFSVGSVNQYDVISNFGSRGPNTCGNSNYSGTNIYPAIVAPGENVTIAWLNGGYKTDLTGTSFSAPHVAGGLALLLSANTRLQSTPRDQLAALEASSLMSTAADLGATGADNVYGYGRLNLPAAYRYLSYRFFYRFLIIANNG